jgi:hypothetical protein
MYVVVFLVYLGNCTVLVRLKEVGNGVLKYI